MTTIPNQTPTCPDVERAVLGAMLVEEETIPQVIEILPPEALHGTQESDHLRIYEAILRLFSEGNPVDLLTVQDALKESNRLDDVGGPYYLATLTADVATTSNVESHARIVVEHYVKRETIRQFQQVIAKASQASTDAFDLVDDLETRAMEIGSHLLRRKGLSLGDLLSEAIEDIENAYSQDGSLTGVPTGYRVLDELTAGWQRSDLILLAARPSMGKTAFALNVARAAARHASKGVPVGFFSLEMSGRQLAKRLLTMDARINGIDASKGNLSEDDFDSLITAAGRLSGLGIHIDDTPGLSIMELRAKARRMKIEHDVGLIIVDYLQLLSHRGRGSRENEITKISQGLKTLAKEMDVPVIALSQLNRGPDNRQDHRPMLADLRESGSQEQDADLVLFLWRPERYDIQVDENGHRYEKGHTEFVLAKQRNGPTDTFDLRFVDETTEFVPLEEKQWWKKNRAKTTGPVDQTAPF